MKLFRKHELYRLDKTRWSLGLLLIASPWILLVITTSLIAHHSVFDSVPCWSDELAYWHEILSFSRKGFDFGYYTMNEALPNCLSFGTHGFGAVSVYALFGKIFGWKAYSMVIANAFFVSFAFFVLAALVKIKSEKLLFILIFTLSYLPLILFSSTSMTELLNFSIMIMYVGLLQVYFQRGGTNWLLVLLVFCTAISFIRIIYIILYLPLIFKRKNAFKFDGKFLISVILWIVASSVLFVLNNLFVSPYPDSFLTELFNSNSFPDFVSIFTSHFIQNSRNFINPVSDNSIQVLLRYFELILCLFCLWKSNLLQSKFNTMVLEYFVVFLMLFFFLMVNIAAYDVFDWRDYRVMVPVVYVGVLFLILNDKAIVVRGSLVLNVLGLIILILSPQVLEAFNKGRYDKIEVNQILNKIEYTKNPKSGFDNSIVVQQFNTNTVLNIPAGIGITYSDMLSDKLKSRYIYSDKILKLQTYKLIDSNETGCLYKKQADKN